ncbi:hypothetical protein F383_25449 [Gossypium arboreum]|uniref:Uncharacterized protein n=1 Tax=Gossypium arboreum TaxID=29729 RepID=A0A0B0MLG3_GOSAR|nr:hypothetical protein F383_25449 [Gossypium arboreum]
MLIIFSLLWQHQILTLTCTCDY